MLCNNFLLPEERVSPLEPFYELGHWHDTPARSAMSLTMPLLLASCQSDGGFHSKTKLCSFLAGTGYVFKLHHTVSCHSQSSETSQTPLTQMYMTSGVRAQHIAGHLLI